ncbi:hypothetical protein NI451_09830 [Acinetobacter indicus]|nr:hypothetical protein [Acinetobacter indicus]MCO8088665.1 hypothetical protein [Acinetobacter indicus]
MSEPYLPYTPQVEQEQPNESRLIEDIIEHMAKPDSRCLTSIAMQSAMHMPNHMHF